MNFLDKIKWGAVRDNIVIPALGRLGTFAAAVLVPIGASADDAHKVGVGVAAFGLILFDFIVDWMARKAAERKGVQRVLADPRKAL